MRVPAVQIPAHKQLRSPARVVLMGALQTAILVGGAHLALAQQQGATPAPAAAATTAAPQKLTIILARELTDSDPPLSLLDLPPADDGVAGARLAINDNNTTGRFLNQEFALETIDSPASEQLVTELVKRVGAGHAFIVALVQPKTLLSIADALKEKDALIFNAGTPDDGVREAECRPNVMHTGPSRAMLTDALGQYLTWKRWRNWFLVSGPTVGDKAFAEAIKRTAQRYGAKIVDERLFKYEAGSRRSDGGHEQVQQQIPTFTQDAKAHDVVIVADEAGQFGEYFPFRTWDARPVAGTAGLMPLSWHPAQEQWGATQFQNRFKKLTGRTMRPLDYNVWMAIRTIGEAATRRKSTAYKDVFSHVRSPDFELAAFKGQKLTYREWNGQLRQPIMLATAKMPVTFSPQKEFLHQFSELDTLGIDKPESKCRAYAKKP